VVVDGAGESAGVADVFGCVEAQPENKMADSNNDGGAKDFKQ
jgi:hypothetical protein